jgi:uncharacterized protein
MTTEDSRRIVLEFCRHLSDRNSAAMVAMVTDDATWWVVGRPDRIPFAGAKSFRDMLKLSNEFFKSMDSFSFTVIGVTAEDERVAIEAVSEARQGDRPYTNKYMIQFQLEGGKIRSLREYMDLSEIAAFAEA